MGTYHTFAKTCTKYSFPPCTDMYFQAVKELELQKNGVAELGLHRQGLSSILKWEFNL